MAQQGVDRSAREPCAVCGDETAIGSLFYSDRRMIDEVGAEPAYLCSDCLTRIRSSRLGQPMTDEQVRNFVMNGSMAAIAWANRGG
jgi:hypothetical protein